MKSVNSNTKLDPIAENSEKSNQTSERKASDLKETDSYGTESMIDELTPRSKPDLGHKLSIGHAKEQGNKRHCS